jgi:hypothetical protein
MKTFRLSSFKILSGFSALGLSACGEGYVPTPYYGIPYVEERTAGHGVQYVRDHILPVKGPILEQTTTEVKDAAPLFNTKQLKK